MPDPRDERPATRRRLRLRFRLLHARTPATWAPLAGPSPAPNLSRYNIIRCPLTAIHPDETRSPSRSAPDEIFKCHDPRWDWRRFFVQFDSANRAIIGSQERVHEGGGCPSQGEGEASIGLAGNRLRPILSPHEIYVSHISRANPASSPIRILSLVRKDELVEILALRASLPFELSGCPFSRSQST